MLTAISKLFGGSISAHHKEQIDDEEIPRYPPFAKGLPVSNVDKVIATQLELIDRIRATLGFTSEEHQLLLLPAIRRYASFVHLLPASEAHHHRGAGGLFRHGLEVAFWAAQASEAVIFNIEATPQTRRNKEPRWRLATALAGLLHDVGKPISDVSVTNKDGTLAWNPYAEALADWAVKHGVDRYFLRWRDNRHKRHERFSLLAVERIIPQETLQYLSLDGPEIIEALLEAIGGAGLNDPVTRLVLKADQDSVAKDLKESRMEVDAFSYGVPVERYVFDAIRRLIKTGVWKVNQPGAKVWNLHQGAFITWRELGDLYALVEKDGVPGIPRDPDTLADILIERGFAIPNRVAEKGDSAYYRYWEVLPTVLQDGAITTNQKLLMLRLESPDLVFTNEAPPAISAEVGNEQAAEVAGQVADVVPIQAQETSLSDQSEDTTVADVIEIPAAAGDRKQTPANPDSELSVLEGFKETIDGGGFDDLSFFSESSSTMNVHSEDEVDAVEKPPQDSFENATQSAEELTTTETDAVAANSDSPEERLKAMISRYGEAKDLLEQAVLPVLTGESTLGDVLILVDNKAAILYPDGANRLGKATKVLSTLKDANAITPDPIMPTKNVTEIGGYRVVLLEPKLSKAIIDAIRELETEIADDATGSPALAKTGERKLSSKEDTSKTIQTKGAAASREEIGQKPRLKPKPQESSEANYGLGGHVVSLERSPVKKNVEAEAKSRTTSNSMKSDSSSRVIERVAARRAQPDTTEMLVDDDLLTPAKSLSPDQAIQLLKEMIIKREGRWLAGPVTKEGEFLVTSAKALELIIAENLTLSKYVIRGMLHGGQRKPILRIKQGNLHLKLEDDPS